ncbi:hypothetical protein [Kocuria sp. KH4]
MTPAQALLLLPMDPHEAADLLGISVDEARRGLLALRAAGWDEVVHAAHAQVAAAQPQHDPQEVTLWAA